jgi:hypothetical protein
MWKISAAFILLLSGVASSGTFDAQLFPPPMDRLYDNRLEAESARYLSINLFNVQIDHARAADPGHFTIFSPDDPAYAEAKGVRAVSSGSRTRSIRVPLRKEMLVKGTHVFLELPRPMQNGRHYAVRVGDIGADVPDLPPVQYDDRRQVNDNIRINQLGYLPGLSKHAYLGQYMGDLGGMPFDTEKFDLLDSNGQRIFTGRISRRNVNDHLVGQIVYEMDFTAFNRPGTYRLHVPGVGISYPFDIGAKALTPGYVNLMRGHYHQRCGMEIDPALSRHHRDACHLDDAFWEGLVETLGFVKPKDPPLYPANYDGRHQKATRGHHDAGDYGKYTSTGAAYVFSILQAMEVFPDRFRGDNLGLPYSRNGIPDLLDEVKWELDWLEQMQDESDGGVFGVIKPRTGGYEQHMPLKEARRLFYPKDTVFTAAYAAALARASRSPDVRKHYPNDVDRYLQKAVQAWEFLEKNERYTEYFHYGATFGDWDERCWAAAELYAATGDEKYHRYFLENFEPERKRWDWWPLFDAVGYAAKSYIFMTERKHEPRMLERCKQALRDVCQMHLDDAAEHPYRLSMPRPSVRHGTYGWYFPGDLAGYNLLMGYALDRDQRYLQCALDNLAYTFGANPHGYFLQTGLGHKRNIEVVDQESGYDGIIEPVPGLPLGIGSNGFYWIALYERRPAEGQHPAEWPLLNRWYDGFNVSTEFTMGPMARETIVAAFFSEEPQGQRPAVKIQADQLAGPAPLRVQFDIAVEPADRRVRQVFWDFGDESFSAHRSPAHVFERAGQTYEVAASIVDEEGLWSYHVVQVNCTLEDPPFSQEPLAADEQTILLLHFDGDLKDSSRNGLEVKVAAKRADERQAHRFSEQPPMWMADPRGSALVLDGAEHFMVEIPQTLLPEPATTPFTMEMMLYLREFAGWAYEGNPFLLGVQNNWDSAVAWQQETWDRASAPRFGEAIPSNRFASEFPRERWCHVQIRYDGAGRAEFLVDGASWGVIEGQILKPGVNKPLVFSFGPFRGMIDQVRLQHGT